MTGLLSWRVRLHRKAVLPNVPSFRTRFGISYSSMETLKQVQGDMLFCGGECLLRETVGAPESGHSELVSESHCLIGDLKTNSE